jgi:ribosome maturation factor RimP
MVEVKLYSAIKGKKFYEGELISYNGQCIVIKVDKKTTLSIDMKNIVKVNQYVELN